MRLLSLDDRLDSVVFIFLNQPFLSCSRLVHLYFVCLLLYRDPHVPSFSASLDLIDLLPSYNLFFSLLVLEFRNASLSTFCNPRSAL